MTPFETLEQLIADKWKSILQQPQALQFSSSLMGKDKRVYALYLTQVYHYAFHTARNQALVAVNPNNKHIHYMQFCLEHALEETGHELMALHDLRAIGINITDPEKQMPPALPPTQLLIAYLYRVAQHGNPVQRLGYSFWAERSYDYIREFMDSLRTNMELDKTKMTFFYSHSTIDDKHAKDVEDIILEVCQTDDDWQAVTQTALMTLDLTHQIIKAVLEEYHKLVRGEASEFGIINTVLQK
jgi:pyrroloquinoline quinone (PQQ) biosynthesis protein C